MADGGNVDDVPGLLLPPHSLEEKMRFKKCTADVD